jgi:hypothetical protein
MKQAMEAFAGQKITEMAFNMCKDYTGLMTPESRFLPCDYGFLPTETLHLPFGAPSRAAGACQFGVQGCPFFVQQFPSAMHEIRACAG